MFIINDKSITDLTLMYVNFKIDVTFNDIRGFNYSNKSQPKQTFDCIVDKRMNQQIVYRLTDDKSNKFSAYFHRLVVIVMEVIPMSIRLVLSNLSHSISQSNTALSPAVDRNQSMSHCYRTPTPRPF